MAKSEGDVSICFPGEDRWELWRLKAGRFELADTSPVEAGVGAEPFKTASHYAFPVNSVYAVPIWAGTDDPSMLGDLVGMQLEKQGLKPDVGMGAMLDYRKVGASDLGHVAPGGEGAPSRTLLLATVLNPNYRHPLPKTGSKEFDISPRFLVLPGNHIVIWKELGRLVMALTRGGQVVYFQGLSSGELDPATVQEIKCVLLGLEGQGVATQPAGIHLWVEDVDDNAGSMLQEELGLDAIVTLRPDPVLPATFSALLPTEIAIQRADKKRAAKVRNIFLALGACYLAFLSWYFFDYFQTIQNEKKLASRVKGLEPEAIWMPAFQAKWQAMEPVMEKTRYPAELVHRLTSSMPPKGVNITSFGVTNGTITVIGECSNANAGRSFGAKLFNSKLLEDYEWIWLQRPTVDPRKKDGTATFRIQGKYKYS